MANTLAHLAVAHTVLTRRPELVTYTDSYYLGTIAPDAIESKQGAVRDDKKRAHLRLGITDMEWLQPEWMAVFDSRLDEFVKAHICTQPHGAQRDFCIGYAVHLLTDKINHGSVRLRILHELMPKGFSDGNWDFIYQVLNELEALDNYLLESRPEIRALFFRLMELPVMHCLPGLIEKEYIEKSQLWWRDEYIPQISRRSASIMEYHEIDSFVELASESILRELGSIIS